MVRMTNLVKKQEAQVMLYDQILKTWAQQQSQYQVYLDRLEKK